MRLEVLTTLDDAGGRVAAAGERWIAGQVGVATVYDGFAQPRPVGELPLPLGLHVGLSADGARAFADLTCATIAEGASGVRTLALADLRALDERRASDASIGALAWAPDGEELVVGAARKAKLSRSAPAVSGWRLAVLDGHTGARRRLLAEGEHGAPSAACVDDEVVVTAAAAATVYARSDGAARGAAPEGGANVESLALAPGRFAAAYADGRVDVGATSAPEDALRFEAHDRVCAGVALHPDGRWLASVGHDARLRVWTLDGGLVAEHELRGRGEDVAVGGGDVLVVAWAGPGARGVEIVRAAG